MLIRMVVRATRCPHGATHQLPVRAAFPGLVAFGRQHGRRLELRSDGREHSDEAREEVPLVSRGTRYCGNGLIRVVLEAVVVGLCHSMTLDRRWVVWDGYRLKLA